MKAVVGSVAQSKRIKLSKAESVFSRFAATAGAVGGARPSAAAYLRRVSSAFDELVRLQNHVGVPEEEEKKKRGKKSRVRRRRGEGESENGGVETGDDSTGEVDSNIKRERITK